MPSTSHTRRSVWHLFPVAMIAGLGLVVVVNAGMVWASLSTFPGVAATDVFDHSNNYDAVLAQASHETALGWVVEASADGAVATLRIADRDGHALAADRVSASAIRPVGPDQTTQLSFEPANADSFAATTALPSRGQWDLRLTVTRGGDVLHATRRVQVK